MDMRIPVSVSVPACREIGNEHCQLCISTRLVEMSFYFFSTAKWLTCNGKKKMKQKS